ncbi:MAG: cobalamin-binding protein [Chlorobium sp.]|jgi:iron complex transport system substrate-binding protein|nr:MAG: cobalamin-binding protein [Chlorobium sp.]
MPNFQRLPIALVLCCLLHLNVTGCTPKQDKPVQREKGKLRIVSLAPSLTEMIFAIGAGDELVGRTDACDWPAAAQRIAVIGAFGRPSLELLASIQPDLVIDVDLADQEIGKKITALGIQRKTFACKTPDDIPAVLKKLGLVTGHKREADSLALSISNGLAKFKNKADAETNKNTVYLEIWNDPFWTGGQGSYTSALIAYAGGENIGDVVKKEYFEISQEWIINKNPDVIACMYMAKTSSASEDVLNRPGWNTINAVKNHRVYDRFDNNLFLRPGPRVLEGIEQLYKTIHTEKKQGL